MQFGKWRTTALHESTDESDHREPAPERRFPRLRRRKSSKKRALENGLESLRTGLGFGETISSAEVDVDRVPSPITVRATDQVPRTIYYSPEIDGQADPGEVVWILAPTNGPAKPPKERAMLVVGRTHRQALLGLLISPDSAHRNNDSWMDIGTGNWDEHGRKSWIRLDRILEVPETAVRREGAPFPRPRFERIASALRSRFGWE